MTVTTKIINADPHRDVLKAAKRTHGENYAGQRCSLEGCLKWLISEHSPVENIDLYVEFRDVPKDCRNQIVRATKHLPRFFCETSRPDITGKPRDPNELTNFDMKVNPLGLIDLARQRLCTKTDKETREIIFKLKRELYMTNDPWMVALSLLMVPNCIYRHGCPERKPCAVWGDFSSMLIADEDREILPRCKAYSLGYVMGKWVDR